MKKDSLAAQCSLFIVLSLVTIISLGSTSSATGNIVKSDLTGTWLIAMRGTTGCGFVAMQANVTINSSGVGTGTLQTHGDCGDSSLNGQTFTINKLAANGSGTAGLSCGTG